MYFDVRYYGILLYVALEVFLGFDTLEYSALEVFRDPVLLILRV